MRDVTQAYRERQYDWSRVRSHLKIEHIYGYRWRLTVVSHFKAKFRPTHICRNVLQIRAHTLPQVHTNSMSLTLSQTLEEVENSAQVLDSRFDNIDMFVMNLVDDMKIEADRRQVVTVGVSGRTPMAEDNNLVPEPVMFEAEVNRRKRPASPPALFDDWECMDSKVSYDIMQYLRILYDRP